MQVLLLGLFVALYLHDATTAVTVVRVDGTPRTIEALPADHWPYVGPLPVLMLVLGPKLLLMMLYGISCMRTKRRLGTPSGQRSLDRLGRFTAALPLLLLGLFIADLILGALRAIRLTLQHTVLIDEIMVLLPTLASVALAWAMYYPIERRLREAMVFRLADEGKPVYPVPSMGEHLSHQLRHQFGLLLIPLLVVFAWAEALVLLGPDHRRLLSADHVMSLTPLGVLGVFLFAPLVIRYVWHTDPLPPGEIRDRMLSLCNQHGVKVRQLLIWRSGGMINAAVTGLVRQVRYILLSDGLLDQVPPREVEAVMAHELAHVKCKHIIWMGLVLITTLGITELAGHYIINLIAEDVSDWINVEDPNTGVLVVGVPAFTITLFVFGWVSRRIERQADIFAARHLAMTREEPELAADGQTRFDAGSVGTMINALSRVAELNHAPIHRRSWRHGSIAWRQAHLRSQIGLPVDRTPVDRTLNRVKALTLIGIAAIVATYLL